ncbi:ATP-binding protein [Thermoanaerobacterium sp. DL9XJH110]|uniref:ATP-binding protein n=1 Tax=Thermoanaerobacterium sp. DL9XJH110 TaxID=3386643 RepID=UPI003BB656DF
MEPVKEVLARMMKLNQTRETSSSQEPLTRRVTIDEARKYVNTGDILPITCEFCGKKLRASGLLIHMLGTYKWIRTNDSYEDCDCEGARKQREKELEEALKKAQEEKERAYREKIERMIKESKLGERFMSRTFENFIIDDKNKEAYEIAKKYADEFQKYKKQGLGLIFIGKYGTGKTHLAAAICHEIIKQNYQPIFGTMINLLEKIKVTYDDEYSKENEERVINRYINCDLLIIDDLGKERPTDWALEKLYYIINTRYEKCLPVIITTNYNTEKLINRLTVKDNIESAEAIVSRIYEMCKGIYMDWEDYRKL